MEKYTALQCRGSTSQQAEVTKQSNWMPAWRYVLPCLSLHVKTQVWAKCIFLYSDEIFDCSFIQTLKMFIDIVATLPH